MRGLGAYRSTKGAQTDKVMADAFKLLFASTIVKGAGKLILLFADSDAAAHFKDSSWRAQCLDKYNIIIETAELPIELKTRVLNAQQRQGKHR